MARSSTLQSRHAKRTIPNVINDETNTVAFTSESGTDQTPSIAGSLASLLGAGRENSEDGLESLVRRENSEDGLESLFEGDGLESLFPKKDTSQANHASLIKVSDDKWSQRVPFLSMWEYWEELLKQANKERGAAFTYKAPPLAVKGQGPGGLVRMDGNGRCISLFEDDHAYGVAMSQGRDLQDGEVVEISLKDRGADNNYLLVGHKKGHSIVYLDEADQETLSDIHDFNYATALLTETGDEGQKLEKFYQNLIANIGDSFNNKAREGDPNATKNTPFFTELLAFLSSNPLPAIEALKSKLSNILTRASESESGDGIDYSSYGLEDDHIKEFTKLTQAARSEFIKSLPIKELEREVSDEKGPEAVKRARLIASSKSRADVTAITSANINPHSMDPTAFKGLGKIIKSSGEAAGSDEHNRVAERLKGCPLLVGASKSPAIYTSKTNPYHVSVTVNCKKSWIHVPDTNVYLAVNEHGEIETSQVRLKTKDADGNDNYNTEIIPFERSDQFVDKGKAWDCAKQGVNVLFSLATLGVLSPMAVEGDALAARFGKYTAKHIREQVKKMVITATVLTPESPNIGKSFAVFADPDKGHNHLQRVEFNTNEYVTKVTERSDQQTETLDAVKNVAKALQKFQDHTIAEDHLDFAKTSRTSRAAANNGGAAASAIRTHVGRTGSERPTFTDHDDISVARSGSVASHEREGEGEEKAQFEESTTRFVGSHASHASRVRRPVTPVTNPHHK
jgi:hypothetical protein